MKTQIGIWNDIDARLERSALEGECAAMRANSAEIAAVTQSFNDYCAAIDLQSLPNIEVCRADAPLSKSHGQPRASA